MKRILLGGRCGRCSLLLMFILGIYGCAGPYSMVEFEVLEPATVSFPDGVSELLILNRAPMTLQMISVEDRQGLGERELLIIDSLISNNIQLGLLDVLRTSPSKRFHSLIFSSQRRKDTLFSKDLILTKREVNSICDRMGADAVVSLEKYSLDVDAHYDFYDEGLSEIQNHYYIFSNRIKWMIYLPGNPRPFDEYSTVDTLFFSRIRDGVFVGVPSSSEMIRELFYESGQKYGRYLVPVWVNTSRTLYTGKGNSLRLASKHTRKGDWDLAYALWEQMAASADSTLAAKALHNMAVYYELEDHLDSASMLIDRALEYDSLELVTSYREELDIRLMNREEVINQVIN